MSRILVLANGAPPPPAFLRRAAKGARAILCADGAAAIAVRAGLTPDLVIGDMDSLDRRSLRKGVRLVLDDDPNASDLEKALRFAARSRFAARWRVPEVWVLGALGLRLDQSLSNLQIVEELSGRLRIRVVDPGGTAEIVTGRVAFRARPNERISLFPVGRAKVRSAGLLFRLNGSVLPKGSRGLSNRAVGKSVRLAVEGRAWLVRQSPPWLLP